MLDHVTIGVGDVKRSKAFYDKALRPLGIECLYTEGETFAGYGANRKAFFWIGLRSQPQTGAHIAFTSKDRETVDAFYTEALAAGEEIMDHQVCARIIIRTIMGPSFLIPMGTTSKQSAI